MQVCIHIFIGCLSGIYTRCCYIRLWPREHWSWLQIMFLQWDVTIPTNVSPGEIFSSIYSASSEAINFRWNHRHRKNRRCVNWVFSQTKCWWACSLGKKWKTEFKNITRQLTPETKVALWITTFALTTALAALICIDRTNDFISLICVSSDGITSLYKKKYAHFK